MLSNSEHENVAEPIDYSNLILQEKSENKGGLDSCTNPRTSHTEDDSSNKNKSKRVLIDVKTKLEKRIDKRSRIPVRQIKSSAVCDVIYGFSHDRMHFSEKSQTANDMIYKMGAEKLNIKRINSNPSISTPTKTVLITDLNSGNNEKIDGDEVDLKNNSEMEVRNSQVNKTENSIEANKNIQNSIVDEFTNDNFPDPIWESSCTSLIVVEGLDNHILEAPVEFSSNELTKGDSCSIPNEIEKSPDNNCELEEPKGETTFHVSSTDVGELTTTECHLDVASVRNDNKTNTTEVHYLCGRESNENIKNVKRGTETTIASDKQEIKTASLVNMTHERRDLTNQLGATTEKIIASVCNNETIALNNAITETTVFLNASATIAGVRDSPSQTSNAIDNIPVNSSEDGESIENDLAATELSATLEKSGENDVDLQGNVYNPELSNIVNACAEYEQIRGTVDASIAIGDARCAEASRCSHISAAATLCTVSTSADCSKFLNDPQNVPKTHHDPINTDNSNHPTKNTHAESVVNSKNNGNSDSFLQENQSQVNTTTPHLIWEFKNGRLVFGTSADSRSEIAAAQQLEGISRPQCHSEDTSAAAIQEISKKSVSIITSDRPDDSTLSVLKSGELPTRDQIESQRALCSKDLNRRVEGPSRLKHLESKLKQAGITDGKSLANQLSKEEGCEAANYEEEITGNKNNKQVVDKSELILDGINLEESSEQIKFPGEGLCEFDVRQVEDCITSFIDTDFYVVYDELEDSGDDEDDCAHQYYHIINAMRGGESMGSDGDRSKQHNPDRENLKSLLKKPGRGKEFKKNRVVFNENKNEFFDADYIILIREECDYDDEEEDGVCTCNDHEMVRLTCCEPNCNCSIYEGYNEPAPQSPKFAPPLEFVDAVTLSPPEGYKDMDLGEQQLLALHQMARRGHRTAVCRDCSVSHEDDDEDSQTHTEANSEIQGSQDKAKMDREKTDQSQQTTPTTPPADAESPSNQHQYILETVTTTTVMERHIMREIDDENHRPTSPSIPLLGSPISGILKGGRLWKQHNAETNNLKNVEQITTDSSITSDEETNGNRRSVRFTESKPKPNFPDDATKPPKEIVKEFEISEQKVENTNNSVSVESTEMMLTFKLGNHVLISNNSFKPNSAVRQLFPCSKPLSANQSSNNDSVHQYLVTAESLRAFEEAKRSNLPQIVQNDDTDESIKRAIERNTLRRSLIRYEPRPKKKEQKTDNSLVERIKQLTCDVDDVEHDPEDITQRASPAGEEARKSPEISLQIKNNDKTFSPSSSSTGSSNSSSVSSTYKKITDLFAKREKPPDIQNNTIIENYPKPLNQQGPAPDLGNTGLNQQEHLSHHCPVTKSNSSTEARKQFLANLGPLTSCVTGTGADDHYYHVSQHVGDRLSVTSSVGTEYSLEDIDEGLKTEDAKRNAPDIVVGTPSASESGDELAMFVQQDASRIERIKKKYQQDNDEDDEHDDYGFNKRPSVRGIKPKFGTTTEILQQIQNQMQPIQAVSKTNAHVSWPYYSEASLSGLDNKSRNINHNVPQYQYTYITEEMKTKMYVQQYRPTTLVDENMYQNCSNQRCNHEVVYRTNANNVHSPVMRIGGGCGDLYHQVPVKNRNGRPESPPPFDVARNIHQTMVYIPYNHIENYQSGCPSPTPQYQTRAVNQNQVNNQYSEPLYHNQPRLNHQPQEESHYQQNVTKQIPKPSVMRLPCPLPNTTIQPHLIISRSDSPVPVQFSTAKSTQTTVPTMVTCNYYPVATPRYRPAIGPVAPHPGVRWSGENIYRNKIYRHSYPAGGLCYPAPDNISLTDSESHYSNSGQNGFRQSIETTFSATNDSVPNSPTKPRFIERGVPEGASSVSPQDSTASTQGTATLIPSPTSQANPKPLFYAMNV